MTVPNIEFFQINIFVFLDKIVKYEKSEALVFIIISFQMQKKLETCRNSNLTNFRRSSFGDDRNLTFMS